MLWVYVSAQLSELRNIGLSNVICEHLPDDTMKVGGANPFFTAGKRACNFFIKMDLNYFLDPTYTGRKRSWNHAPWAVA
ncbi:MAG: hypothetical protein GY696_25185 [Gammaproteobacteria bacterium]|nr:hypothetical protein [Gammaproteobacteria bacterium]